MNKIEVDSKKGGINGTGALTLIFITLKLCGVIDWSWVWVLSPIWISIVLAFIIGAVVVCFLRD